MTKPRHEYCDLADIREFVEKRLCRLPARKSEDESPAEFGRVLTGRGCRLSPSSKQVGEKWRSAM
jgi:hypothetical protein